MGEFNDNMGSDFSAVDIDDYMNSRNEEDINKLSIIHLFGKEKIENIQKSLSKATGLAFITVDYRGEPITESTLFSRFCQAMRDDREARERCKSSDAFGAIQAAVTKTPNVYFCPCGLLEVAIPIVVRGHYLGGFVGGQIRCNDAPESICHLSAVMPSERSVTIANQNQKFLDEIPVYSYEKFKDIANLVFLVINQLSENEIGQHMQSDLLLKKIKKLQTSNRRYAKDNKKQLMELMELRAIVNPYELMDMLTSLVNLSVIEGADETGDMLMKLVEHLKYSYRKQDVFVHLSGELESVEQYLEFYKKRLGDRLDYSIQVPKDIYMQKIPSNILMPFIKNALHNGIMMKEEGGQIEIKGYMKNTDIVLEITDTGCGMTDDEIAIKYEAYQDKHEGHYIKLSMDYAKNKVQMLFGDDYEIAIENHRNKGRKCVLVWPERLEDLSEKTEQV